MELQLYNKEVEEQVLGTLLNSSQELIGQMREFLTPACFYSDFNRCIFDVICVLNDEGKEANMLTILDGVRAVYPDLQPYDIAAISAKALYSTATLKQYIDMLVHYYKRRKLWMLGQELVTKGTNTDDDIDEVIEQAKHSLDEIDIYQREDSLTLTDVLQELEQRIKNNSEGVKNEDVTLTGFPYIDNNGGLESGTLIVIGATSSMGKTSLADSFALNIIKGGNPVAFYSLEMTNIRIATRLLSSVSMVSSQTIFNDKLNIEDSNKVYNAIGAMNTYGQNLYFPRTRKYTLAAIKRSIRLHHSKHGIKGAVIDYVQLISDEQNRASREQFIGECAHQLQALAKELNIWVILLSQINRSISSFNPVPSSDSLRDSGQIKEAADSIMLIYRPELYNTTEGKEIYYPDPYQNVTTENTAMIILAKNRNGVTGSFICGFDAKTTSFFPLDILPTVYRPEKKKKESEEEPPF